MFGGFFGRQVPMKGGAPQGPVPMAPSQSPVNRQIGVAPQGRAVQVNSVPQAAPQQPAQGFQQAPLIPPTRVPMGQKKDCPICRG